MPFLACNRQVDAIDRRQCNLHSVPNDIERYSRSLEELLLDMNHIKELPKVSERGGVVPDLKCCCCSRTFCSCGVLLLLLGNGAQ